jgi:hypothetical protein
MTTTLELIDAISKGDAVGTEAAFNAAMAEKISGKLDDMRGNVAKAMFSTPEEPQQEVQPEVETTTEE